MNFSPLLTRWIIAGLLGFLPSASALATPYTERDRASSRRMIQFVLESVPKHHFDPAQLPADFARRADLVAQQLQEATSPTAAFAHIANFLGEIDPLYLRLLPPPRSAQVRHDWGWTFIGEHAYVSAVNPGTDAERQGIRLGDRVLQIGNQTPDHRNPSWIVYVYQDIVPSRTLRVVLQTGDDAPREVVVTGRVISKPAVFSQNFYAPLDEPKLDKKGTPWRRFRGDILVWQPLEIDLLAEHRRSIRPQLKQAKALVLDLRNLTLHDTEQTGKVAGMLIGTAGELGRIANRKKTEFIPLPADRNAFQGPIVVLINSRTSGFAEVLAHVLRRSERGLLVGESTHGKMRRVTVALSSDEPQAKLSEFYGLLVPAEKILVDGTVDLEGKGVAPDWQIRPTPADLAAKRDPVLAKAFEILKAPLTPEEAGKLSYNW